MANQSSTLILGPGDHGRAVSADAFAEAEFVEPWSYERDGGRLVVMAPEGKDHIRPSNPWRDRLIAYKLGHPGIIEEVVTQAWVRVADGLDRIGDIGVYLARQPPCFNDPDQVLDLMFEIVSPVGMDRERDYVKKRAESHRLGVREYVIIDRFMRSATVLTLAQGDYDERVLTAADSYTTPLLPGLAILLAEVF